MPYYPGLKNREFDERREFIVGQLLGLRKALARETPRKTLGSNLLIATWNLRDFGKKPGSGFNPEPRLGECFYYIAEILSHFDVIALQEINDDLRDFLRLKGVLGSHYDYLATDTVEGRAGNGERMVFVYDTRKVSFRNIAGEIVLPPTAEFAGMQFARTPFVVSFQCGWFKFDLCTTHLYYGDDSGEPFERRVREIEVFSRFMKERADRTGANTFILGDFNVVGPGDATWEALHRSGFVVPEAIQNIRTNIAQEKHYDQIAFHSVRKEVTVAGGGQSAGAFRFFDHVFTRESDYTGVARNLKPGKWSAWRTWQMSDHLPLWVEVETDFAEAYLSGLRNGAVARTRVSEV